MKKALFATTALVLSAGVAAADVTISGYGRTAVDYQENRANDADETQIEARVRMNIDATTSTDQGVDFGARIRLQYDDNNTNSTLSPGYIYVESNGLQVSVGNVNTAYDSAGLIYESEVGLISRSFGNSRGNFYAFDTDGYGLSSDGDCLDDANSDGAISEGERELCGRDGTRNRMGIAVKYSIGGFTGQLSYVDPNQVSDANPNEEISVAVDYEWNAFQFSAAAVMDGASIEDNDQYFLGAYYTMPGTSNGVGLNFYDNGLDVLGNTITLYGDYEVAPMTTVSAYIANNDGDGNETDNAFGIGAKYDLGGAYLAGSLERGYDENVRGDMGVRFDF